MTPDPHPDADTDATTAEAAVDTAGPHDATGPARGTDWAAAVDLSDAEEVHECPYCGRPFRAAHQRDLHLGEDHEGQLTDDQRAAHEAAVDDEEDDLFLFHMKVVVALGLLYSTTALGYTAIVGLTG